MSYSVSQAARQMHVERVKNVAVASYKSSSLKLIVQSILSGVYTLSTLHVGAVC